MTSDDNVLVYHHRHNATNPIIPNGLAVIKTPQLEEIILNHPDLQCSTKPIARGSLNVDIYECDLLTEVQKTQHAGMPNYESNVAGVTVPFKVFLGKLVGSKDFDNLVILSATR